VTVNMAYCNLSGLAQPLVTQCPSADAPTPPLLMAKQQLQQTSRTAGSTGMTTVAQAWQQLGSSDSIEQR